MAGVALPDRRLAVQAQRDIYLLSNAGPGRRPAETRGVRGGGNMAAQKGPRADRVLTRVQAHQRDVELLEQAEDHSCSEQLVLEGIFMLAKPGDEGLETALIEMIGNIGVEETVDTAQVSGR